MPKGPTIPDDCFGGASNAFHTRRVTGQHCLATRTAAWAPPAGKDKQYFSAHVTLQTSGLRPSITSKRCHAQPAGPKAIPK